MKPYPLCNVLSAGPNVSHVRRTPAVTLIIRGAILAAIFYGALYAWRYQP